MNFRNLSLLLVLASLSLSAFSQTAREQQIADRLTPIGESCMVGDDCAAGSVAEAGPLDPETVYNTYCMACHTTGAAGAPMIGEAADWEPRIANGLDVLYSNAINGIGAMPAKGLCMDCSDEDIESTVDYILSQSE
ncbi:MAG: c-type cytochrome [Pseudomonadales bacterium]